SGESTPQRARDAADEDHGDRARCPAQDTAGRSNDTRGERSRRPAQNENGRARRPAHSSGKHEEQREAKLQSGPCRRYLTRFFLGGIRIRSAKSEVLAGRLSALRLGCSERVLIRRPTKAA